MKNFLKIVKRAGLFNRDLREQTDVCNQIINGKTNKKILAAGFSDLPAINATVFRWANTHWNVGCTNRDSSTPDLYVRTLGLAVVLVVL